MNKSDLIRSVADATGASLATAEGIINSAFDHITEHVAAGGKVKLDDFGGFEKKWADERQGRNPVTGKAITVPGRFQVKFRPYTKFKEAVQTIL